MYNSMRDSYIMNTDLEVMHVTMYACYVCVVYVCLSYMHNIINISILQLPWSSRSTACFFLSHLDEQNIIM